MTLYTLDTNILIRFSSHMPRDIFCGPWDSLEAMICLGQVCICEMVQKEIARGGDDLDRWARSLNGFTCTTAPSELQVVQQVSQAHPDWVRGTQNEADPWIIAHAATESRVIVTDERRAGPGVTDRKQKIPNVAYEFGIQSMGFFDFARSEGWNF